ncbi:MAG: DciA family protein [Patescibacteria group bacterium]|nr:DciA family protein [Patescibacteria group bacterium]
MLHSIGGDLKKSISKAGISREIEAFQICEYWQIVIEIIFTKEIAKKSQAIKYRNGALTVAVLSSVLAQEFKFKEEEIKEEMNKKIRYNAVKKIRFET